MNAPAAGVPLTAFADALLGGAEGSSISRLAEAICVAATTAVPAVARCWTVEGTVAELRGASPDPDHIAFFPERFDLSAERMLKLHRGERVIYGRLLPGRNLLVGFVAIPLLARETLQGILGLFSRDQALLRTELTAIGTLVPSAAAMLALALELDTLRRDAAIDAMTNMLRSEPGRDRLVEEIRRAERYGHPLSLLYMDIDRFKSVNDTYGHEAGNTVLRSVSAIIRASVRDVDLCVRWGGEELGVIALETETSMDPTTGALAVANRVLTRIRDHRFTGLDRHQEHLTISIGVAGIGPGERLDKDPVVGADLLIRRADGAMYASKQGGRDQYTLWRPGLPDRPAGG